MSSVPIIYGSIISPYVRKTIITLNYKKIPFELKPLNPFNKIDKEFILTLNPIGKVPVYQKDNFILSDSSVICAYLESLVPEPSIFPKNSQEYARSLWFEEFADTQLIPSLIALFFNTVLAPMLNMPSNHEIVKQTLEVNLPNIFNFLDKEMSDTKFMVGNQLTIADISIGQLAFIQFDFLDFKIDISKWKRLSSYINNIAQNNLFNDLFLDALKRLDKIRK